MRAMWRGEISFGLVMIPIRLYAATEHRDVSFRPVDRVDPIMWERSYYTEPEPQGIRAYALLRDALERSGMVAVAKVALRNRETLAALRTRDGVLVLVTLMWPDEVRVPD